MQILSTQPTEFVGKFSFHYPIADAALFGMHLMTGTLSWADTAGTEYSARLMDTFEVVGHNGVPPIRPMYAIEFHTQDNSDPMIPNEG